jgi:hypothetical protein
MNFLTDPRGRYATLYFIVILLIGVGLWFAVSK